MIHVAPSLSHSSGGLRRHIGILVNSNGQATHCRAQVRAGQRDGQVRARMRQLEQRFGLMG